MKKSRFTESQIIKVLKEVEAGRQVQQLPISIPFNELGSVRGCVCLSLCFFTSETIERNLD